MLAWQKALAKLKNYWRSLTLGAVFSTFIVVLGLVGGYNDLRQFWSELFQAPTLALQITPKDQIIQLGDTINLTYTAADYGYLSLWQQALQGAVTQILPQTQGSTLKLDASLKSRTLFNLKAEGQPDRISFILLWTADQPEHLSYRVYPDKAAFAAAVQALSARTEVLQKEVAVEIHAKPF